MPSDLSSPTESFVDESSDLGSEADSWLDGFDLTTEDPSNRDPNGQLDIGTKSWRFRERTEHRQQNPYPWRHFWLPRASLKKRSDDEYQNPYDDSEDDTPVRGKLVVLTGAPVTSSRVVEEQQPVEPSLARQQQLTDKLHADAACHSCQHCDELVIDMRKHTADFVNRRQDPMDPGEWSHLQGEETGHTLAQASQAAQDGCTLFSFLVRLADRPSSTTSHPQDHFRVAFNMVAHAGGPTITFVLRRGGDDGSDETMGTFEIYTVPGDNPVHQYIGHWQPPNLVPDSQLSFTRARTWLEKCQRGHVECQRFNSSYMPKRVLEIVSDPMEEARFRVCLSADPEPAPYATLSYCWGGDQEAKTTMTRLPSYHDGIPLEKLPRTIRDALTITHGVGLKYLWVDSICIVQDSDADKAEQISQMHRIYRGALFTVAVAAAKTSVDGFLEPRRAYRGTKLGVRLDDNVFSEIVAVPTHTNRSDVARTEYPLYTRGWTYQESQLSTRVFAYGDREMVYQCLESRHRDGGQDIAFNEGMPTSSTVGQIFRGLDPGNRSIGRLKHPIAWRLIVTTFTHRALTVADDKLLAIAAIAEDYANTKPVTKYLAGLWEDEFLYECLWSVKPKAGCTRPSKYRAPSWSWASMEGVIEFYLPSNLSPWKFQPSAKLLQAETTLSTKNNPFGMVKEGFIRILAKCRRVVWLSPSESSPAFDPGYGWACNSEEEDSESPWRTRRYKQRGDNRLSFIMDVMEEWPKSSRIAFWCVEVYTFNAGGFDMDSMSSAQHRKLLRGVERAGSIMHGHALVLQEETQLDSAAAASLPGGTSSSGVFHRVGVMRAQGFPREDPHFADWPYWFDDDVSEVREFTII